LFFVVFYELSLTEMESSCIFDATTSNVSRRAKCRCHGCGKYFRHLRWHLLNVAECSELHRARERRLLIAKQKVTAYKKAAYLARKNKHKNSKSLLS